MELIYTLVFLLFVTANKLISEFFRNTLYICTTKAQIILGLQHLLWLIVLYLFKTSKQQIDFIMCITILLIITISIFTNYFYIHINKKIFNVTKLKSIEGLTFDLVINRNKKKKSLKKILKEKLR